MARQLPEILWREIVAFAVDREALERRAALAEERLTTLSASVENLREVAMEWEYEQFLCWISDNADDILIEPSSVVQSD